MEEKEPEGASLTSDDRIQVSEHTMEEQQNVMALDDEVDDEGGEDGSGEGGGGVTHRDSSERPVFKLTVRLIDTYKLINKKYYEAKALNASCDDKNFDYKFSREEILNERYVIRERLGKGSFGQVVRAYDRETDQEVAIKIIKSKKTFTLQAKTEIDLLNRILQQDPHDEHNIVRLLRTFEHRNHQCLVFEMLSFNLYELLKNTRFKGQNITSKITYVLS